MSDSYTFISNAMDFYLWKRHLKKRITKGLPLKVITTLKQLQLHTNKKEFRMGTVVAPSYASIYMEKFKNTYIYPESNNSCLFYARYIDDIFILYTSRGANLNNFLTNLIIMHDSNRFDHENSTHQIAFLSNQIYIDKNRKLPRILHTKPTNTQLFPLQFFSNQISQKQNSLLGIN